MKRLQPFLQARNLWIALLLLLANGVAWFSIAGRVDWPVVEPVLHPEIAEIRTHWQARDAVGESFQVVVTDQMAAETIAWFMGKRPNLPVSQPLVEIHPDGVVGGALVNVMGLRTPVTGRARIWLANGKPDGVVEAVHVAGTAAPDFILAAVDNAKSFYDALSFPIEITRLELREGEVLIEGVYR